MQHKWKAHWFHRKKSFYFLYIEWNKHLPRWKATNCRKELSQSRDNPLLSLDLSENKIELPHPIYVDMRLTLDDELMCKKPF